MTRRTTLILTAFAMSAALAGNALADEMLGKTGGMKDMGEEMHGEEFAFGEKGDPADVTRTIDIDMMDNAFNHRAIDVKPGETVRFNIHNKGEAVHEFNIAMTPMHMDHQAQMMQMVESGALEVDRINHGMMSGDMMHEDPNSVLLEPGKSAEMIWRFKKTDNVEFACNVPGHYESGMRGPVMFQGE